MFLAETVETGDKNRDDFYCMQMSLVMSMRFIFGDDWNNAKCLSRFSAMAKFFLPCNKSHFFFFNKTGLGLRFMLISHSKPIKSREQNRHNEKYNYTCRRVKWGEHGTCETLVTLP